MATVESNDAVASEVPDGDQAMLRTVRLCPVGIEAASWNRGSSREPLRVA